MDNEDVNLFTTMLRVMRTLDKQDFVVRGAARAPWHLHPTVYASHPRL